MPTQRLPCRHHLSPPARRRPCAPAAGLHLPACELTLPQSFCCWQDVPSPGAVSEQPEDDGEEEDEGGGGGDGEDDEGPENALTECSVEVPP